MNMGSLGPVFNSSSSVEAKALKDISYKALTNQKMDWCNLLLLFVKRYLSLDLKFTTPEGAHKCLTFDDADVKKRGKKIEETSKIFQHVDHHFIFGFKLLVAGYWNGSLFIPIDFSFHRENKNNKKKIKRGKGLPVVQRFKELNSKKRIWSSICSNGSTNAKSKWTAFYL